MMKHEMNCFLALWLFFAAMCLCGIAQAQTPSEPEPQKTPVSISPSGFDISAHFGYLWELGGVFNGGGKVTFHGFGTGIALGYRWRYVGLFVEQSFYAISMHTGNDLRPEEDAYGHGTMGQTMLAVKFYIPISNTNFFITLGLAAGQLYNIGKAHLDRYERDGVTYKTGYPDERDSFEKEFNDYGFFSSTSSLRAYGLVDVHYQIGDFSIGIGANFLFTLVLANDIEPRLTFGYTF